ncbi:MAG: FAD-binding oxidoreductase [Gemmatimonadota bacterium]
MARTVDRIGLSNDSIWTASAATQSFPPLKEDIVTDVCVVGAGIAGMLVAYELSQAGKRVVVLETARVGSGMTSMTSAHLTTAVDDRYFDMLRRHGEDATRKIAQAHTAAIDRIEGIVRQERIVCGFSRVDGLLTLGRDDSVDILERELEAVRRAGLHGVELERYVVYPARGNEPCLRFPRQARFHPLHFLHGLTDAVEQAGGRIFGDTHVDDVSGGERVCVRAGDHVVVAAAGVIATNAPISERDAVFTKQTPYVTYVIAAPVDDGAMRDVLGWDTEDPYHYVRLQHLNDTRRNGRARDYVVVGGEDHKSGHAFDAQDRFSRLFEWVRERIPTIGDAEFAWSGEIIESDDRIALLGRSPDEGTNVYLITGESGVGMTHSAIGAAIIRDAIQGVPNEWATLYEPNRETLRSMRR